MSAGGRVSLVVPLQDEEASVVQLLDSVRSQVRLPDEVVLVDAGSRDATAERALSVELPCPVRIVRTARVFPGTARNEGAAASTGDWLAFTDGGISLQPDWLAELAAAASETTDVVFGNMDPICDDPFRRCAAIAYVGARNSTGTRGPVLVSSLLRRASFGRTGGFPPQRAAEDLVFMSRLREQGARVVYAPRALVRWQIAGTFADTFKRFALYSYHNLVAGWGRYWHLGTVRLYALLGVSLALLTWLGAGAWVGPMLPAFFVARASKAAWVKRRSFDFATLTPGRIAGAAAILVVIDLATATGFVRWLADRVRR